MHLRHRFLLALQLANWRYINIFNNNNNNNNFILTATVSTYKCAVWRTKWGQYIFIYTSCPWKRSHLYFRNNFVIWWDIFFSIFKHFVQVTAWYSFFILTIDLRPLPDTWHQSSCRATPDFTPPVVWPSNLPDLNTVDCSVWSIMQEKVYQKYYARESVPDTHGKYWRVQTLAGSGVGTARPQTYCCSHQTVATLSQCLWHVCESSRGIFYTSFALDLHSAVWSDCWIVGLCNV